MAEGYATMPATKQVRDAARAMAFIRGFELARNGNGEGHGENGDGLGIEIRLVAFRAAL